MKKEKKDILKKPIERIELCMILNVKYKGEFIKRFLAPEKGLILGGKALGNKEKVKNFLLDLDKVWIKQVNGFLEEYR